MKLHRLVLVGLLAAPALLTAQERITISSTPRPGQVLATHTTMEMATEFAPDASVDAPPPAALPKMNMVMTTSITGTMTVGVPDEQGRYEAHVTMDDVSSKMTMNGQPASFNLPANLLNGQTMTFTYNRDGQVTDVANSAVTPAMTDVAETVKKLITNVAGFASPVTLAIGETSTRPVNFALPIPGSASGSLGMTGDLRMTLVSITAEGADRIAHLTTTTTSQVTGLASTPSHGGGDSGMAMQMSGDGTIDMNIDRGIVKSMQSQTTFAMAMPLPGKAAASMPPLQMRGTMKMSSTTEAR